MEESLFAYSLSQSEQGWIWRLWNETGDVVAAGEAHEQISANHRLLEAFERTQGAPAADAEEPSHVDDATPSAARAAPARLAGRRRSAPPVPAVAPRARVGVAP